MLYEIHYRARPAWEVGDRTPEHIPGSHYHDDYSGKVLGVREVGSHLPSLRHMADKDRPVVELDLTADERAKIASHEWKVEHGTARLVAVTCDDRWGQVATVMRLRGLDPDAWEADSAAAVEQAEADNELAQMEYDAANSVYVDRLVSAVLLKEPMPEPPVPPVLAEVRDSFSEEAVRIARALPAPDVHTGTGLYSTKATPAHNDDTQSGAPAGQVITLVTGGLGTASAFAGGYITNATRTETRAIVSHNDGDATLEGNLANWLDTDDLDVYDAWSTIQAALDQLWTDQATVIFPVSQYIRIFAGTYVEDVAPNLGLRPDDNNANPLVIEGDPGAARSAVIVQAAAVRAWFFDNLALLRHMTWLGFDGADYCVYNTHSIRIVDSVLQATNGNVVRGTYGVSLEDSELTLTAGNFTIANPGTQGGGIYERCSFTGPGIGTGSGIKTLTEGCRVSGCSFRGLAVGMFTTTGQRKEPVTVANCTFHDCTVAFHVAAGGYDWKLVNNILEDCTTIVSIANTELPDETATYLGPKFLTRNNCYYGYTNFITGRTYAQFVAMSETDTAGDLDATDPLLTDPGAGDFSLQAASPCRHAGHGSGVTADVDGTAFDKYHPDIGAESTGVWAGPQTPTIAVADDGTGTSLTVTITAASTEDELDTYHVYYRYTNDAAWTDFGTRTGSGDVQITGLTAGYTYEIIVLPERYTNRYGPPTAPTFAVPTTGALAASGRISEPIENLRTLLANSGTYQTLVGAKNANGAKATIFYPARDHNPKGVVLDAYAVLALGDDWRDTAVAGGGGYTFAATETMSIIIQSNIDSAYRADGSEESAFLEFTNAVGAILAEMEALTATSTYLIVEEFSWLQKPMRTPKADEKRATPFYQAVIGVRRGVSE